jgi:acetate kinase
MASTIVVLNAGSSSIKFALFGANTGPDQAAGVAEAYAVSSVLLHPPVESAP